MRILLAIDFSACSHAALDSVLSRPWPENSSFKLLHVLEPFDPIEPDPNTHSDSWQAMIAKARSNQRIKAEQALESAKTCLEDKNKSCDVSTLVCESQIADETIIATARDWSADLVILGSHSRRGLQKLLLGSTSNAVLLKAPCSVEIIKCRKKNPTPIKKVLLALDNSKYSDAAFKHVLERPWPQDCQIKLIHVVKPANLTSLTAGAVNPSTVMEMMAEEEKSIYRNRESIAVRAYELKKQSKTSSVSGEVLSGEPKEVILKQIEDWSADLVILGSHGRNLMTRLFLGSVSHAVALHADCSVTVVRISPD